MSTPSGQPEPDEASRLARILNAALGAGCLLMENGGNMSRVEETVSRMGRALGADAVEVSATPSGIIATLVSADQHRTRIQRARRSGVRLSLAAEVLSLVLEAENGRATVEEVEERLRQLQQRARLHGVLPTALAVGLACGAFAVLLGGTARDFALVSAAAALAQLIRHQLLGTRIGGLLTTAVVAMVASSTAWVLAGDNFRVTVAASVLLLVPGAPLVSGTSDLFRGDTAAGLARTTHAMLTVTMIGAGVWATILLLGGMPSESPGFPGQDSVLLAALMGGLAAAGFSLLFDVPGRHILQAGLVGFLAILARSLALAVPMPAEAANLLAGMAIGIAAESLSRSSGAPFPIFAVPGYITLVPGTVFIGGVLHLVAGEYVEGLSLLVRAQLILIAIAVGMGAVPAVLESRQRGLA